VTLTPEATCAVNTTVSIDHESYGSVIQGAGNIMNCRVCVCVCSDTNAKLEHALIIDTRVSPTGQSGGNLKDVLWAVRILMPVFCYVVFWKEDRTDVTFKAPGKNTNPLVTICTARCSRYVQHTGHYIYQQFNIHKFYVLPTQLYLCVLCGSQNKQRLFPYTTLTDWFL